MDLLGAVFGAHAQDDGPCFFSIGEEVIDDFKIADGVGLPDFVDFFLDAVDHLLHFDFFGDFFAGPVDAGDVGAVVETQGSASRRKWRRRPHGRDRPAGNAAPTGWGWE